MRQRKYILVQDKKGDIELRFGYPMYHKDLLNKSEDWRDCLGGGQWQIDSDTMDILLFGKSDDFGAPKKQDLEKAIKSFDEWDRLEWICEQIYDKEISLSHKIKIQ